MPPLVSGEVPSACRGNARVLHMQQKVGADEWAHIHHFQCEQGRLEGTAAPDKNIAVSA